MTLFHVNTHQQRDVHFENILVDNEETAADVHSDAQCAKIDWYDVYDSSLANVTFCQELC